MSHVLSRCKTLLVLAAWACVCMALVLVWPPLPTPSPPLPDTSPRPLHTPAHGPHLTPGLTRPALADPRARRGWWRGGGGETGPRLYRSDLGADDDDFEGGKQRSEEYYEDEDGADDDVRSDYVEDVNFGEDVRYGEDVDDDGDEDGGEEADDEDEDSEKGRDYARGDYDQDEDGETSLKYSDSDGESVGETGRYYQENDSRGTYDKDNRGNARYDDIKGGEGDQGEYEHYGGEEGDGGRIEYTGGQYNVTPPGARLLIYNRIPKCASSTMQTILRWCSRQLGFGHISSQVYDQHQLSRGKQRELVYRLTTTTTSASSLSYDRHMYYTDFTAQGAERPVYINLVREPVERFISSFYYRRSKERLARILAHGHLLASPSPNWRNRTVGQCVVSGDPECSFTTGTKQEMVLTYFCGHHRSCRTVGSKTALQVAKQVVSEEYSVVGLVGHMDVSLCLMETLVPGYLTGALHSYHNIRKKEVKVNKNSQKPEVSRKVRQELRRRMAYDIDFYNFLKQRLFLQAKTFLNK